MGQDIAHRISVRDVVRIWTVNGCAQEVRFRVCEMIGHVEKVWPRTTIQLARKILVVCILILSYQ